MRAPLDVRRPRVLHPGDPRRRAGSRHAPPPAFLLVALGVALLTLGDPSSTSPAAAQEDAETAPGAPVVVVELRGTVTPVMRDHLADAIDDATTRGATAVVAELDTPGGQLETTRQIIDEIIASDVPVVVHVTPTGARAGSAGTFVTYAGHVAAMAPGSTIGAATPVNMEGGEVLDKIVEDSVSYIEALAEQRDRDPEFGAEAVREGTSITAAEASERGAIDVLADDRAALLEVIDGREVPLDTGRTAVLATADAPVIERDLGFARQALQALASPDLAFIFLSLGVLGILYEFANPGAGLGGTIGAIMLILAFYSLAVLPTNLAGVALILLAAALFIGELFAPGVGALAAGGAIALAIAGLLLFEQPTGIGVSWWVLFPTVLLAGLGALGIGVIAARTRKQPVRDTGPERLIGHETRIRVVNPEEGTGQVYVEGAWWSVTSSAPLEEGQRVRVVDVDGLRLEVEPAGDDSPQHPTA